MLPSFFPTANPNNVASTATAYDFGVEKCIPEPTSTLSLLVLGTLGAGATLKRKLKPSKSTEKQTAKVG